VITSNLPFSEWGRSSRANGWTAALLDRLTHRCQIFEIECESFASRSMKTKEGQEVR